MARAYGSTVRSAFQLWIDYTLSETATAVTITVSNMGIKQMSARSGSSSTKQYYLKSDYGMSWAIFNGSTSVKSGSLPTSRAFGDLPIGETIAYINPGTTTISIPKTASAQSVTLKGQLSGKWDKWYYLGAEGENSYMATYTDTTSVSATISISALASRTITYDANGGSGAPNSQTDLITNPITLSTTEPTREKYVFTGWTSTKGDYQPGDTYNGTESITLYAVWAYGYGVSLNSITSKRCDANKSENDEGTYGVITGSYKLTGALANTGTLSAKYRKNGATSWTTVSNSLINPRTSTKAATDATKTVSFEIGPFGGEPTTSAALDTDSSYDIQVTVTDSGNNESALADYISTAFFTIDIQNGGKEIAFGTPANDTNLPSEGVFKCGMEMRLKDKTDSFRPILDYFYPVGSYYETSDSTFDPNVVWGGTWVPETEGQVHVSAGTGYIIGGALTNTSDGGAATVKLVTANMPAHSHEPSVTSENFVTSGDADANNTRVAYSSSGNRWVDGLTSQSHFHHRAATNSVGSGTAHENMPPYIVVNRWHRTA